MTNNLTAIYIRLSKEDEHVLESESVVNQRKILINYIKENNLELYDEYIDDGYSGTTFDRPAFNRLIKDIESKKINIVITKDLSRLGRDYIETGRLIEKYFPENNIRYISVLDNIDTYVENINSDLIPFKSLLNDLYAKDISKKVKISLNIKKRQGLYLGWKAPYGYKKSLKDKYKLIIDKKVSNNIRTIFSMAKKGKSAKEIASYLTANKIMPPSIYFKANNKITPWSSRTIDSILENPTYIGNITQGIRKKLNYKSKKEIKIAKEDWIIIENTHEPIINKELFYKVQKIINKRKTNKRVAESTKYLFTNYLYCKECGYAITIVKSSDKKRSYTSCSYYRKHSKEKICSPHSMRYELLECQIKKQLTILKKPINMVKKITIDKDKNIYIE